MIKKVTADTITNLTAAFNAAGAPVPSTEDLIEKIRDDLSRPPVPSEDSAIIDIREAHVTGQQRAAFEKILTDVPEGFRLIPVFYKKIEKERAEEIRNEFSSTVRHHFLKFLAQHHQEDLLHLGICDHGIERMKKGLKPTGRDFLFYHVNVDHIVEVSGSGAWGTQKSKDPRMPEKFGATSVVNHFDNLILLPVPVHELKNRLNEIQGVSKMRAGDGKWILTLIPEPGAAGKGFISVPQRPDHPLFAISKRAPCLDELLAQARRSVNDVARAQRAFLKHQAVRSLADAFCSLSKEGGTTPAARAAREAEEKNSQKLSTAFNILLSCAPRQESFFQYVLKPQLRQAVVVLEKLLAQVREKKPKPSILKNIQDFCENPKTASLKESLSRLPLPEAARLISLFDELEEAAGGDRKPLTLKKANIP